MRLYMTPNGYISKHDDKSVHLQVCSFNRKVLPIKFLKFVLNAGGRMPQCNELFKT